ncbi:hypothetical protein K438DRAFT_1946243 [Mycena galopus ATCC 62051]|nr:hypothetical protein K438DRAFT_1946243 [Mycena galopus ATCC 62051]
MADTDPVVLSDTPLLLLPSEVARQLELARYVWVGTAAVFIWDILSNLKGDYMLLFKYKLCWPVAAYFASRITSAVHVIGFTIFLTSPVGECRALNLALQILYPVAVPSASLLFFSRVRAVYSGARTVTFIFGFMWITELANCIIVPIATGGINIGGTRYCICDELPWYVGTGVGITPALFDTAVFLAISFKLVQNSQTGYSSASRVRAFITGQYLPSFSRSLLVDGQVYYMITVVSNITTAALAVLPGIGLTYRSLAGVPNVMLTSVMACRVYRHTRLNLLEQSFLSPSFLLSENIGFEFAAKSHSLQFVRPTGQTTPKDCEVGRGGNHPLQENGQS